MKSDYQWINRNMDVQVLACIDHANKHLDLMKSAKVQLYRKLLHGTEMTSLRIHGQNFCTF